MEDNKNYDDYVKSVMYSIKQAEFAVYLWKEYLKKIGIFLVSTEEPRFYVFEVEKGLKEYKKEDFREMLKGRYITCTKTEYLRYLDAIISKKRNIEVFVWIKSESERLSDCEVPNFEACKLFAIFDYMPSELLNFKDCEIPAYISRNSI